MQMEHCLLLENLLLDLLIHLRLFAVKFIT